MKKFLALAVCCASVSVPYALAQSTEGDTTPTTTPAVSCTPMKSLLSTKHWRDAHPLRGENPCDSPNARALKEHFALYRRYRSVTPFRCQHGSYGTWAVPCYIIECESGFSWTAYNPSGARGPYQLLGWGAPYPARTFRQQVANHEIAARVYAGGSGRSNWVC